MSAPDISSSQHIEELLRPDHGDPGASSRSARKNLTLLGRQWRRQTPASEDHFRLLDPQKAPSNSRSDQRMEGLQIVRSSLATSRGARVFPFRRAANLIDGAYRRRDRDPSLTTSGTRSGLGNISAA